MGCGAKNAAKKFRQRGPIKNSAREAPAGKPLGGETILLAAAVGYDLV
jgi:hypothetical protein